MDSLFETIVKHIALQKNQESARAGKASHKYDGFVSWGLTSPELEKVLKQYRSEIKGLHCKEVFGLAEALSKTGVEELVLAGNYVLQYRLGCFNTRNLNYLDSYTDYLMSWSTTDDFCIDVLQTLLLKYPTGVIKLLRKWNKSKDIWKQRCSVVVFVRKLGESGEYTDLALELCENLAESEVDLIRKAVGWCLKDVMRGDKRQVLKYVTELRGRGVSSTVVLYAVRDLVDKERKRVLDSKV